MPAASILTPLKLAVLLALAGGAHAQSLNELYQAAQAYDATYLAARAGAEAYTHRLTQAGSLNKPQLGLGSSGSYGKTDLPGARPTVDLRTVQVGLSARYALFNRANAADLSKAERGVLFATADLVSSEQDLMVRVAQAYFDVLAAKEALATSQGSKKAIAEQLASAKRNFEVGTATITDTREAQARFDRAVAQELAAENDLRVKRVVLDQLVGRVGVEPKPLALPVALPAVEPVTVEPWLAQAEASHPGIRKAQLGFEIAQLDVDKARAGRLPTLDLTGSLGVKNDHGKAAVPLEGTSKAASVGFEVKMPLYTGGAIEGRVSETVVLAEKARNDLEFARRFATEKTKSAFLGLQSLNAQVKALESAESSSKLALEATQLGYKVGVRVNLDVLNAQAQLYATQNDLAKARFDTIMTGLRLRQASGQLRPEDIAALDALLAK